MREGKSWSGRERNCCFLNVGSAAFANVSAVTGLNYIDDARASAVVDWDLDGKLDLWVTNRTGPRIRFLRNNSAAGHFLAVRLVGQTCNRDAIGARVTVSLSNDSRRFVKTLRAGDGFLAQSSKWLCFGLGDKQHVARMVVRWPDGLTEEFSNVEADRHYRIVQGAGNLEFVQRTQTAHLVASELDEPGTGNKARLRVGNRKKLAPMDFTLVGGKRTNFDAFAGEPLLIHLWSRSCTTCLEELAEFTRCAPNIRQSGLNIIAIHLTESFNEDLDETMVKDTLGKLGFPFVAGFGNTAMVREFDRMLEGELHKHRQLTLPSSFLIDKNQRLAIVYDGPVSVDELRADLDWLRSRKAPFDMRLPFSGRWHQSPNR